MDEILPIILPIVTTAYKTLMSAASLVISIATPPLRSLFSSHPDLASLALLIVIFYFSLMILQQAGRWAYTVAMTMIRLCLMGAFLLALVNVFRRGWKQTYDDVVVAWKSVETVVLFIAEMIGRDVVERAGPAEGQAYVVGGGGKAKRATAGYGGKYKGPKTRTMGGGGGGGGGGWRHY